MTSILVNPALNHNQFHCFEVSRSLQELENLKMQYLDLPKYRKF